MGISGVHSRTVSSLGEFKCVWAGKKVVENKAKVVGGGRPHHEEPVCLILKALGNVWRILSVEVM